MKRLFNMLFALALVITSVLVCFAPAAKVSAASGSVRKLSNGKTYSTWDMDGNGSTDKLIVKQIMDGDTLTSAKVYLNGKCRYTFKINAPDSNVITYVISLGNGEKLLYMKHSGPNEDGSGRILAWSRSENKYKNIFNVTNAAGLCDSGVHFFPAPISAGTDTVKFSFRVCNDVCGAIEYSYSYRYANGKMKRTTSAGSIVHLYRLDENYEAQETRLLTAARSIKVYTKPGDTSASNVQQTIKAGKKVKFRSVWTNGKTFWLKVTVNGKTGYIKGYRNSGDYNRYFKDEFVYG